MIAALATIGVEVRSFLPIDEYRNADGSIPSYWHGYGGGATYHGRRFIQLTHDYNYRSYGQLIGVNLVDNPSLALDPHIAARVFATYFAEHRIRWLPAPLMDGADLARAGEWRGVRLAVNGGTNGLTDLLGLTAALDRRPTPRNAF